MPDMRENSRISETVGLLIAEMHSEYVGTRNLAVAQLAALGDKAVHSILAFLHKERDFQSDLHKYHEIRGNLGEKRIDEPFWWEDNLSDDDIEALGDDNCVLEADIERLKKYAVLKRFQVSFTKKWEIGFRQLEVETTRSKNRQAVDDVIRALGIIGNPEAISLLQEISKLANLNCLDYSAENLSDLSAEADSAVKKIETKNPQ